MVESGKDCCGVIIFPNAFDTIKNVALAFATDAVVADILLADESDANTLPLSVLLFVTIVTLFVFDGTVFLLQPKTNNMLIRRTEYFIIRQINRISCRINAENHLK